MEKTNYVFVSPVDEALFNALTPLSERTDVFSVIDGPEERELFEAVRRHADENRIYVTAEGHFNFSDPDAEQGIFGNIDDYQTFFRVAEEGALGEKKAVYFRAATGDTGIYIFLLNSASEVNVIETITVNYCIKEEANLLGRTRVFIRTVGCRPGKEYRTPRYFDLLSDAPENVYTEADYEARKEADRKNCGKD